MSIKQNIEGSVGKIFLSGEIDLDKSPLVRDAIKEIVDQVKTIEIQMSAVNYIDSSGIASLIEGMQISKEKSKEFFLTEVSNEVMKVIELAHLDKFFKIKSTTAQNASPEVNSQPSEVNSEPEIEASENIDLNPSDNTDQKSEEPSANQTEEKEPSIKRDDDEGDKIKFKR